MENIPSEFVFELSAKGEKIIFHEAEGISTVVTLPRTIKKGENPFKFRLPSFPKTGKLMLHKGSSQGQSKLMSWFNPSGDSEEGRTKEHVSLTLKSKEGQPFVEWKLFNAHPVHMKSKAVNKSGGSEIEDLELNFSFYTLSKR